MYKFYEHTVLHCTFIHSVIIYVQFTVALKSFFSVVYLDISYASLGHPFVEHVLYVPVAYNFQSNELDIVCQVFSKQPTSPRYGPVALFLTLMQ